MDCSQFPVKVGLNGPTGSNKSIGVMFNHIHYKISGKTRGYMATQFNKTSKLFSLETFHSDRYLFQNRGCLLH